MSPQVARQMDLVIYFFYGLSYFTMGIAIMTVLGRASKIPLMNALPWLAAFGLIHGFHEWIEMIALIPGLENLEANATFTAIEVATLGISAFFLLQFGIGLAREELGHAKLGEASGFIPFICLAVWSIFMVISVIEAGTIFAILIGRITARYFLYFPANVASGIASYLLYRSLILKDFKRVAVYFLIMALFFWANAIFAGLIVPSAPFWPASVINRDEFFKLFGVPVIVFRGSCAIGITVLILLGVRVFDIEEEKLRERRRKEFEVLEKLSGKIARSVSPSAAMPEVLKGILKDLPLTLAAGAIFVRKPQTDELWLEAAENLSSEFVMEKSLRPIGVGQGRMGIVAEKGESIYGNVDKHPDVAIAVSDPGKYGVFAITPFVAKGQCLGALMVLTLKGVEFGSDDKRLLEVIGSQLGLTLENALLEEQRRIATILQRSLLSPPPVIDGMEIAVRYEPATPRMIIGGDFYDFIELPDNALAIVVGDVSGKGLMAASLTSFAKNTIRAFLYESSSPARALFRANRVLNKAVEPGQFITALVVVLRRNFTFTYSGAGHPRPLLCDEACRHLYKGFGLPLGAFPDVHYIDSKGEIRKNAYIVLYTDGLTEAKRGGEIFGEDRLESAMAGLRSASAREVADRLIGSAKDFAQGELHDDLALLVLRRVSNEFVVKFTS